MGTAAAPTLVAPVTRVGRVRGLPRSLVVGVALLLVVVGIALIGPFLVPDPNTMNLRQTLQPPSLAHPFGTDNFGRDVLSRIVNGAALDLAFGLVVVPVAILGTLLGLWTGTHRRFDALLMGLVDIVVAFPALVLVIAIVAFLGPGQQNFYVAVMFFGWTSYARVVRSEVLVVHRLDYVSAADLLGLSPGRVLLRHVLPNVAVQPVLMATTDFAAYVLLGAALGYLGLGIQPPTPEWGVMIAEGTSFLAQAPWMSVFPGLALVLVAGTFLLLGDGLSDLLRPEVART
jgi:peptide/nickel transport system permease protein